MKSIGMITFHFANNFGAVLQTFALYKVLTSMPNCEVEIIPFRKKEYQYLQNPTSMEQRMLENKLKKLRGFLKRECNLAEEDVSFLEQYKKFDYYVAGSDQIWRIGANNVWSDYYFLSFAPEGSKCFSYASSIGMPVTSRRLKRELFEKFLPRFKCVSVREKEHVRFVSECAKQPCFWVLDPTLLLTKNDYDTLVADKKKEAPFLFLFWLENDANTFRGIDFANLFAKKYNLRIIHAFYDMPDRFIMNNGGSMYYQGVEEFLWYIKHADFVITNSFHATVFSILYQKSFYTFTVKNMNSRITTLLGELGLMDRLVNTFLPLTQVGWEIDYGTVNQKLEVLKKDSMDYLKQALDIE